MLTMKKQKVEENEIPELVLDLSNNSIFESLSTEKSLEIKNSIELENRIEEINDNNIIPISDSIESENNVKLKNQITVENINVEIKNSSDVNNDVDLHDNVEIKNNVELKDEVAIIDLECDDTCLAQSVKIENTSATVVVVIEDDDDDKEEAENIENKTKEIVEIEEEDDDIIEVYHPITRSMSVQLPKMSSNVNLLRRSATENSVKNNSSNKKGRKINDFFTPKLDIRQVEGVLDLTFGNNNAANDDDSFKEPSLELTSSDDTSLTSSQASADKIARVINMNHLYRTKLLACLRSLPKDFLTRPNDEKYVDIISNRLSLEAQTVLARVLFLQGPWFRISTARKHLERIGLAQSQCDKIMLELQNFGIFIIPKDENEWRAIINSNTVLNARVTIALENI